MKLTRDGIAMKLIRDGIVMKLTRDGIQLSKHIVMKLPHQTVNLA